jgi:hypothetical protein
MMLGGVYDPFSNIAGSEDIEDVVSPGVHVGIVKRYISSTHSCMVLIPSVNDTDPIGPVRIMKPLQGGAISAPAINSKVVVGFLDGKFNNAIILGYLA